jgi:hypothetical protein
LLLLLLLVVLCEPRFQCCIAQCSHELNALQTLPGGQEVWQKEAWQETMTCEAV